VTARGAKEDGRMFGGLGMGEMVLIFLVVLLLFGAKRLPEIGSSLGKGIREFKGSMNEVKRDLNVTAPQTQYVPPPQPVNQFRALEAPAPQAVASSTTPQG
jgi:sec-independent protein translocase protein TatA